MAVGMFEQDSSSRPVKMIESLCETCANMREVRTAKSRFVLCRLSAANDGYPKYPPQPICRCAGFEPKDQVSEPK
jgi:hypothetical protein